MAEQDLDIPRLVALNKAWATVPPLPSQLVRVLHYLGIAPKAEPAKVAAPAAQQDAEAGEWIASMPVAPPIKIRTPEEYFGEMNGRS